MIDLSSHVRLRFSGGDRIRYLNGQVTNDVRRIAQDSLQWACVTNHKGKLEALVTIHAGPDDAVYVDGAPELQNFLPARLEKYIIADDVAVEDVSETTAQAHFLGDCPPLRPGYRVLACQRFGVPGWDVWCAASERETLISLAPIVSAEAVELLRIDHGIPAWSSELDRDILPPEANLDAWAIDYHKGCYIGQEIISRLKTSGKVNRLLQRLITVGPETLEQGWLIFPESTYRPESPKPCGEITSCIWHPKLEKSVALGYVRREQIASDLRFYAGPEFALIKCQIEIRNP